jgi:hypothetical protein
MAFNIRFDRPKTSPKFAAVIRLHGKSRRLPGHCASLAQRSPDANRTRSERQVIIDPLANPAGLLLPARLPAQAYLPWLLIGPPDSILLVTRADRAIRIDNLK